LGSDKDQSLGEVTSLDIINEYVISGYASGKLMLWELSSGVILKSIFGVHENPIISVKFYQKGRQHFISSDIDGNIYLIKINKVLFSYTYDKQLLLEKSMGPIFNITVTSPKTEINLAAMVSLKYIWIVAITPKVSMVYKKDKPNFVKDGTLAYVSWGKGILPGFSVSQKLLYFL
jgi:WD40 repeat protein